MSWVWEYSALMVRVMGALLVEGGGGSRLKSSPGIGDVGIPPGSVPGRGVGPAPVASLGKEGEEVEEVIANTMPKSKRIPTTKTAGFANSALLKAAFPTPSILVGTPGIGMGSFPRSLRAKFRALASLFFVFWLKFL